MSYVAPQWTVDGQVLPVTDVDVIFSGSSSACLYIYFPGCHGFSGSAGKKGFVGGGGGHSNTGARQTELVVFALASDAGLGADVL